MLLGYGPVHAEWTCVHAALVCLLVSFCLLLPFFLQFLPFVTLLLSYGFFLTSYSSLWSAPRTRIRASTLTTNRKVTAMPHTTITADLNQPFDVHVHFAAQISLDFIFAVDHFA